MREGPLARADIARATKLTAATVGQLVGSLLDEGIVEERGRRSAGTGKPGTLLRIVPDARHVICLDLSDHNCFVGGVVNLAGEVVARRQAARRGRTDDAAVRLVAELAGKLLADTEEPVLGVGVGTPGIVFPGGVVQESSNLRWHHVTLADDLSHQFHVPVHVLNDANAAVLGELQFGQAAPPNLLLVKIGLGVGAGLVLDGHLIEGDSAAAGEIGHVVVDPEGEKCTCGNRGCLETVVAGSRLQEQLADKGETDHARILATAGESLGVALAPVISMLNLHTVVLSGPSELLDPTFVQATTAAVKQRTFPLVGQRLETRLCSTGADDVLLGTAAVVMKEQLSVR
jgi:predicted NBD/HSP70 family sugar kinase